MQSEEQKEKRDRVWDLLINPLIDQGMTRKRGVTVDDHDKMLKRLASDLAYMSGDSLETLREMLARAGTGDKRDIWPSPITIAKWAEEIEPRPFEEIPGLIRWFKSVEGPKAVAENTLVETYEFFHSMKRPPIGYAATQVRERAAQNMRNLERVRERMERGVADEDDIAWKRWYERKLAYCRSLVPDASVDA